MRPFKIPHICGNSSLNVYACMCEMIGLLVDRLSKQKFSLPTAAGLAYSIQLNFLSDGIGETIRIEELQRRVEKCEKI